MQQPLFSWNALLVVCILITSQQAYAAPLRRRSTDAARTISLPLRRVQHPERHLVDPRDLHLMHSNHAEKRFAQLTGRQVPTDEEINSYRLSRRYDRSGIVPPQQDDSASKQALSLHGDKAPVQNADETPCAGDAAQTTVETTTTTTSTTTTGGAPTPAAAPVDAPPPPAAAAPADPAPPPPAPPAPPAAPSQPATGNITKLNIIGQDVGYFSTVQMGTPPRDFKILMDSGSADFWIGGEDCTSLDAPGGCGNHVFIGPQSSSSFQPIQQPFSVKYGTGAVAGTLAKDNMILAGLQLSGLQFGVAAKETKEFAGPTAVIDGLMGLAQSKLSNTKGNLTPVEALKKAGLIDAAITSYKISRFDDKKDDGTVVFGGLDESKFDPATLVTVDNVNAGGFWEANIDAVSLDGKDLDTTRNTAILDTGTTLMNVPAAVAEKIHAAIPGSELTDQGFTMPCDHNTTLTLTFGGRAFDIAPEDLVFNKLGNNVCTSGINSGGFSGNNTQWLVGDVFLKSAYFSHNVDTNKISLAKLI